MPAGVVIAGAGQAGFQVAFSLRSLGYDGAITLIGKEPHIPYQRPPLSKAFLAGKQEVRHLALRPAPYYATQRIDFLAGETVTSIERADRRVTLSSGGAVPYETLVLALGARVRPLPVPGAEFDGVCYLRSLDDAVAIRSRLQEARDVVVIGGGFIGLELAAVACAAGKHVTVVEVQSRLMPRVVSPVISDYYLKLHASHGIEIKLDAVPSEIAAASNGRASGVVLKDATHIPADLVLAGIGVLPNIGPAQDAGLETENGIVVDAYLRTGDPYIYAIGDCAAHPNPFTGSRVRIESVQNAVDQAVCVAAAICGEPNPYRDVPWFWTDQFDVKLQMAGLSAGYDRAQTRGDPGSRRFSVFYFHDRQLIAVDSLNRPADHIAARGLLARRAQLTPEQAGDESVDLKSIAQ
jgi:3-phenylpropionate/trans-cinnamate dioxygenase ferredoxin reductase subunit